MCNIQGALIVSLLLNTVNCVIFSFVPKSEPNLDAKGVKDSINLDKNYALEVSRGFGKVSKDEEVFLPLESVSRIGLGKNDFLLGNLNTEVSNVQRQQNELEIPFFLNLGQRPNNSRGEKNSKESAQDLKSDLNDFDYQTGEVPPPPNLPNGQPPPDFGNSKYQSENVTYPPNFLKEKPPFQQPDLKEMKNNFDY